MRVCVITLGNKKILFSYIALPRCHQYDPLVSTKLYFKLIIVIGPVILHLLNYVTICDHIFINIHVIHTFTSTYYESIGCFSEVAGSEVSTSISQEAPVGGLSARSLAR